MLASTTKAFFSATAFAVALSAAPAMAQDAGGAAFEAAIGAPQPFLAYPNPWPLKNLVADGVLTVGTTGASPPRTFVDPASGELTGSYVELFSKLGEDLGLQVEFVQIE